MKKKQTAVQQAIEHFKSINYDIVNVPIQSVPYILEQFLSTEREQICNAHLAGQNSAEEIDGETEIEYYTQTFKP